MRITIIAPGSRGDIQPYLGLGVGLKRAGHAVAVVTTMDHDALVKGFGLELFSVPVNVQEALQRRGASAAIEGGGLIASFRELSKIAERATRLTAELALEASRGADAIVVNFGGAYIGESLARKTQVPLVQAFNVPLTPTAAFPGVLVPGLDFGPRTRWLGHLLTRAAIWLTARGSLKATRKDVLGDDRPLVFSSRFPGLVEGPVLYGYSPAFLPRGPEWGADVEVTGTWFTDEPEGFAPPPELTAFLAAGPPPVCIGFGSMSMENPAATTALVLEAVKASGVRAVLLAGWGGLKTMELPPEVLALESAPHSWLYPRCSAVVHHGGAGTTAAALRAGVPAVVVPFHGDQFFWARRVHEVGTGPKPVLRKKLTAPALAAALTEATTSAAMRDKARGLGEQVRAEDGVGRAVAAIARIADRGPRSQG